jgi:hypothetical protein
MIRIAITPAAFEAIAAPVRRSDLVSSEAEAEAKGECQIWL